MQKAIKILTALLIVQLALVMSYNMDTLNQTQAQAGHPLLDIQWSQLDSIQIDDQENELALKKRSTHWVLPNYHGLKVNPSKINELLEKLEDLSQTWPVGKTAETAKRFEVSTENFQRKITLNKGDEILATLFTGTSPGYRKVHARLDNSDDINIIELSNYEASTDAQSWFDTQMLQPSFENLSKITLASPKAATDTVTLIQKDENWTLQDLANNESPKDDAIKALINDIKQFRLEAGLGLEDLSEYQQDAPIKQLTLHYDTDTIEWTFSEPKTGPYVVLKSTNHPVYFQINRAEAEKLTLKNRSALIEINEATELTTKAVIEQTDKDESDEGDEEGEIETVENEDNHSDDTDPVDE